MNVLFVGAHPDDIDHFCAGTLAKYAASGADIAVVVMTDGSGGSPDRPVEEIARMGAGVKVTEAARRHAREMLQGARRG